MWKPIPDFPYEVSDEGQVRRSTTLRLLKPLAGRYLRVDLRNHGERRRESIHILVLEAFVGPRPEGCQGAHQDGNSQNNRLDNLAWKTQPENMQDKNIHGTMPRGEKHHNSVLTDEDYNAIILSTGGHSALGRKYGVSRGTIANIRRRNKNTNKE